MIKRIKMILQPDPKKPLPKDNNYRGVVFKNEVLIFEGVQDLEDCAFRNCVLIFSEDSRVKMSRVAIGDSIISGDLVQTDWSGVTLACVILNNVRVSRAKWVGVYILAAKGQLTLSETDQAHTSIVGCPGLEIHAKSHTSKHQAYSTWRTKRDSDLIELSVEEIKEYTSDLVGLAAVLNEDKNESMRPIEGLNTSS